jgi:hypothetical protein
MPGRCFVQSMQNSEQRFLFGYNKNAPGGEGHIFSAAGALHFGGQGINEVTNLYVIQCRKRLNMPMMLDIGN